MLRLAHRVRAGLRELAGALRSTRGSGEVVKKSGMTLGRTKADDREAAARRVVVPHGRPREAGLADPAATTHDAVAVADWLMP